MRYDLFGVGLAMTDLLIEVPGTILEKYHLHKGNRNLLSQRKFQAMRDSLRPPLEVPAGSTGNLCMAFATLGGKAAMFGPRGNDDLGKRYHEKMESLGIFPFFPIKKGSSSALINLITPDAQRTFAACIGVGYDYDDEDIKTASQLAKESHVFHTEGYLFTHKKSEKAIKEITKRANTISFDPCDIPVINEKRAEILSFIKTNVSMLFINEEEAKALLNAKNSRFLPGLEPLAKIAVLKLGAKGSIICNKGARYHIPPVPTVVKDTTGAGDYYAAGFLYSYLQNNSLEECGKGGAMLASKVIQKIGTDPSIILG